jgi:hypothetical protein
MSFNQADFVLDLEDPNTFIENSTAGDDGEDIDDPQLQQLAQRLKNLTQRSRDQAKDASEDVPPMDKDVTSHETPYHPLLASPEPPPVSMPNPSTNTTMPKTEPKRQAEEKGHWSPSENDPVLPNREESTSPMDEHLEEAEGLELQTQAALNDSQRRDSDSRRDTSAEALALSLLARPSGDFTSSTSREPRVCDLQWLVGDYDSPSSSRVSVK